MALREYDLEQKRDLVHVHRFKFAGLELAPLVRIESQKPQAAELDLAQGYLLLGEGLGARGHEGVQLELLGDLGLMGEELDLLELYDVGELEDQLLGVLAELGALPPAALGGTVQQLTDGELGVLP